MMHLEIEKQMALRLLRANLEKPWPVGARGHVPQLYLERWENDGGALSREETAND